MDIREIETKIMYIANKRWENAPTKLTAETSLIHLMEEVGEISREFFSRKIGSSKFSRENLREEVVDAFLEVIVLAHLLGVDVEEETRRKLKKLIMRKELRNKKE